MLKRIPKSDISIRPFKAYKQWSFNEIDSRVSIYEANETSSLSSSYFPQKAIYGQFRNILLGPTDEYFKVYQSGSVLGVNTGGTNLEHFFAVSVTPSIDELRMYRF